MTEFREGDCVRITIDNARVVNTYGTSRGNPGQPIQDTGTVLVYEVDGALYKDTSHTVNMGDPGVTVERVAPAEWPPLPGDKWRDRNGSAWFAFYGLEAREVFMIPADPIEGPLTTPTPATVLAKVGPLTLVHREDGQDGQGEASPYAHLTGKRIAVYTDDYGRETGTLTSAKPHGITVRVDRVIGGAPNRDYRAQDITRLEQLHDSKDEQDGGAS